MVPKVSVIIPVYNAEKYLNRCVDSVLKQDYEEFELLLVDDGSTDSSGKICDHYAETDRRVRVIHKENTGVSDSRNLAIKTAKGEYLQFLDSDDWITPEAVGLLVRAAEENDCEMVIADFYRVVGERVSQKGRSEHDGILSREKFALEMMENPADFYYGVLWNKLYRRSLIEQHALCMDKDISWCEDFIFNMEYIRHIKNVYVLRVPIYYYVKTPGSLVSQGTSISKTIRMKSMVFKCYNEFYKDVFDEEDYEKRRLQVYRFLIDAAGDGSVGPTVFPGSMKLGNERISVSFNIMEGAGLLFDHYREEKLLDRYLEMTALKQDLSFEETKLLFFLSQTDESCTLKEIAEVTKIKRRKLVMAIQKLISKEMIGLKESEMPELEKKRSDHKIDLEILNGAEPVLLDILTAKNTYQQVKYSGLTEEEIEQYELLTERIRSNVRKSLM